MRNDLSVELDRLSDDGCPWGDARPEAGPEPDHVLHLLDEERVRAVVGPHPWLDPEAVADLVRSANSDPHEGAEWLPYYKLTCAVLMRSFGGMAAVAEEAIGLLSRADDPRGVKAARLFRTVLLAERLAELSVRPCGIGPDRTPERAAEVDRYLRLTWQQIRRQRRGK